MQFNLILRMLSFSPRETYLESLKCFMLLYGLVSSVCRERVGNYVCLVAISDLALTCAPLQLFKKYLLCGHGRVIVRALGLPASLPLLGRARQ
jgi:hypothetical protein